MSVSLMVAIGAIILVSIGVLSLTLLSHGKSLDALDMERFNQAKPGSAKIIEVGTSIIGKKSDELISAALRFEVTTKSGKVYKARSPWVIEPDHIGQIRVGESISVKIDAKKQNMIFPDVAWAHYDWSRQHEVEPIYED